VWWRLWLPAFLAAAPLRAQAGDPVVRDCSPDSISKLSAASIGDAWRPFHPDSMFDRLAEPIRRNQWVAILDTVTRNYLTMPGNPPVAADSVMRRELGALLPFMRRAEEDPTARAREAARAVHWQIVGDPNEVAYDLFRDDPTARTRVNATIATDARRRLCWTTMTMLRVLNAYNDPGRERVVARLDQLSTLWDRFGEKGYSQLPWELFLNGRLKLGRPALEPPLRQLVLLHPAAGVEVTGGEYPNWQQRSTMTVEVLGMLFYKSDRSSYFGASGMVVASSGIRLGFGPLVHFGRAVKVGYAFRPKAADGTAQSGAVMTIDVFKFVTGVPDALRRSKDEALQQAMVCLRGLCPAGAITLTGRER
jgi:hypothetical protein